MQHRRSACLWWTGRSRLANESDIVEAYAKPARALECKGRTDPFQGPARALEASERYGQRLPGARVR